MAAPAPAGSLAASSAAGGSSASSAGSASSEASSDSSSRRRTAAGTWRITEVAALTDQPGMLRLQLQPVAEDPAAAAGSIQALPGRALVLPAALVAQHRLAVGRWVLTQPQPYGVAYAEADGGPVFFLALDDSWQRELDARPVQL
jgi:hypothetical protein